MASLARLHFHERFDNAPLIPRRSRIESRRRRDGLELVRMTGLSYDWGRMVFKSVWEASADELIAAGYADVDRHRIPYNWQRVRR